VGVSVVCGIGKEQIVEHQIKCAVCGTWHFPNDGPCPVCREEEELRSAIKAAIEGVLDDLRPVNMIWDDVVQAVEDEASDTVREFRPVACRLNKTTSLVDEHRLCKP
jgi:uncharacterized Zn finger protein (UPF0148 family)